MVLNPDAFLKPYKARINRPPKFRGPLGRRPKTYKPMPREKPKEKSEEEHYWTVEQWEEWAANEFYNNPDTILPEWFIEEMEEENKD